MEQEAYQYFIGAHITREQSNLLSLATVVLGETRSALIRHAITDFIKDLKKNASGTLMDRMANRLNGEWQVAKAASTDNQSFKRFKEQAAYRLQKAGVEAETITAVMEKLETLTNSPPPQ